MPEQTEHQHSKLINEKLLCSQEYVQSYFRLPKGTLIQILLHTFKQFTSEIHQNTTILSSFNEKDLPTLNIYYSDTT